MDFYLDKDSKPADTLKGLTEAVNDAEINYPEDLPPKALEAKNEKLTKLYEGLSLKEREYVHTIFNKDSALKIPKKNLESIIFKRKPPSAKEFLDHKNGYLTKAFSESVFKHIQDDFIEIIDSKQDYSQIANYGCTRQGKCQKKDIPILMADLSTKMVQDIKLGDLLMGDDSKPRKVLETHKGFGSLYKVKQNKADDYVVNENHILTLQYTRWKNKYGRWDKRSGTTIDIPIKEYLALSKTRKHKLKGVKAILDFPEKEVKIEPYFLGLWLGDGCKYHASITTGDRETKEYIREYANKLNLRVSVSNNGSKADSLKICSTKSGNQFVESNNTLFNTLKSENLLHNKHIPKDYLLNSKKIRLEVLAGLIDSDGYLPKDGSGFWITFKDDVLTKDTILLARSLGFRVTTSKVKKRIKSIGFEDAYNEIRIFGNITEVPTRLKRKQADHDSRYNPLRTGIEVVPDGDGEYFGFQVDGNNRYLMGDLTITHNSFLARLLIYYTFWFVHFLRDPNMYFNVSPTTSLAIYILSFKFPKVYEVYLKHIYRMLEQSPRCQVVKFQDKVATEQVKLGLDTLVYSKASLVGHITLASGMQLVSGNDDVLGLLGADILQAYISEIAFFIDEAGATEDQIYRLYTDVSERIEATVGKTDLAFTYLDTSANDADSLIENHIIKNLSQRKDVYFQWRTRWETRPELFPTWGATQETFKVIAGNGSIPARIVTHLGQLVDIPKNLIIEVPIDVKERFEENLLTAIRNIAGRPTSAESKFINNRTLINQIFDNPLLENVEGIITADAGVAPEGYIWELIKEQFFVCYNGKNYKIRRAQKQARYIGLDLAFSAKGDVVGITMLHKEWSTELKDVIYVCDFSFAIGPGDNGISLEAVQSFITDLQKYGELLIAGVGVDTFQSANLVQYLNRHNLNAVKQSVDTTIDPYQFVLSCLLGECTLKAGKNIFLKNNLDSLHRVKGKRSEKIDHAAGRTDNKYQGDYEQSRCGINAKDVSDSVAQAVYMAFNTDDQPVSTYEHENARTNPTKSPTELSAGKQQAFALLHKRIG